MGFHAILWVYSTRLCRIPPGYAWGRESSCLHARGDARPPPSWEVITFGGVNGRERWRALRVMGVMYDDSGRAVQPSPSVVPSGLLTTSGNRPLSASPREAGPFSAESTDTVPNREQDCEPISNRRRPMRRKLTAAVDPRPYRQTRAARRHRCSYGACLKRAEVRAAPGATPDAIFDRAEVIYQRRQQEGKVVPAEVHAGAPVQRSRGARRRRETRARASRAGSSADDSEGGDPEPGEVAGRARGRAT